MALIGWWTWLIDYLKISFKPFFRKYHQFGRARKCPWLFNRQHNRSRHIELHSILVTFWFLFPFDKNVSPILIGYIFHTSIKCVKHSGNITFVTARMVLIGVLFRNVTHDLGWNIYYCYGDLKRNRKLSL